MKRTRLTARQLRMRDEDFSLAELEACPNLSVSQADTLKMESGPIRVWLSRCDEHDGEPYANKVTIETRDENGRWSNFRTYQARG